LLLLRANLLERVNDWNMLNLTRGKNEEFQILMSLSDGFRQQESDLSCLK